MRKFFQTEWHGIPFSTFSELSESRIAGGEFYEAFYGELFRRYKDWGDFGNLWRMAKLDVARLIAGRLAANDKTVLSIGCGLGMVEHFLLDALPSMRLEVLETTNIPLRWLRFELPQDQIHVGFFPQCLPTDTRFDFIYLSAVDYCFDENEWLDLLRAARGRLRFGGRCLVVSASVDRESPLVRTLRIWVRSLLITLGLRQRGQFWGYLRTAKELNDATEAAGFALVAKGELADGSYWLEGRKS
jgi:hypothetical protein